MPDETTSDLASVHFGAEPVAVFRFGYERFELRAGLDPGNTRTRRCGGRRGGGQRLSEMVA